MGPYSNLEELVRPILHILSLSLSARASVKGPQFIHSGNLGVISSKDEQIKTALPVRGHFIKPPHPDHKQTRSQLLSCSIHDNSLNDCTHTKKKVTKDTREEICVCVTCY